VEAQGECFEYAVRMMSSPMMMMLIVLLNLITTMTASSGQIQLKTIHVPHYPQVNESVSLWCEYDLKDENLYSIKWYKDQQEFYRFLPKESPPQMAFPVAGALVSLNMSNERLVHLVNISLESIGLYTCEVSTEAPKFKTIARNEAMNVVHPPGNKPVLSWDNQNSSSLRERFDETWGLRVGEVLMVSCLSSMSFPPAKLKFYINDEIANEENVSSSDTFTTSGVVMQSSKITLKIRLERRHFRYGDLTIKCTSDIHDIYFQSSSLSFAGIDLGEIPLEMQSSNSDCAGAIKNEIIIIFSVIIITMMTIEC